MLHYPEKTEKKRKNWKNHKIQRLANRNRMIGAKKAKIVPTVTDTLDAIVK